MEALIAYLLRQQLTISSMESLTGGLFAAALTGYSGVSAIFRGSLVTYSDQAKIQLGQVDARIIAEHGAISAETARAMAINSRRLFATNIAVSFTGNAGPLAQEGKAVGLVYTGICIQDAYYPYVDTLTGDRETIRKTIIDLTVRRLKKHLGICG